MKSNIHFDLKKGNLQNNFKQRDIYQKEKVYQNVQRFCLWYVFNGSCLLQLQNILQQTKKKMMNSLVQLRNKSQKRKYLRR